MLILSILLVVSLTTSLLCLGALGNLHTKVDYLREEVAEFRAENLDHFRMTRRRIADQLCDTEIVPRLKKLLGERPTIEEQLISDIENGIEPSIDLSGLGTGKS